MGHKSPAVRPHSMAPNAAPETIPCSSDFPHVRGETLCRPLPLGSNPDQPSHQDKGGLSQAGSETASAIRAHRPSSFSVLKRVARRTYFPERDSRRVAKTASKSQSPSAQSLACLESAPDGWHEDLQYGIEILAAIQIIGQTDA